MTTVHHVSAVPTVGDLLAALEHVDPTTRIMWDHEGPDECCEGHFHDITLTTDHTAVVDASRLVVTITLSEGSV